MGNNSLNTDKVDSVLNWLSPSSAAYRKEEAKQALLQWADTLVTEAKTKKDGEISFNLTQMVKTFPDVGQGVDFEWCDDQGQRFKVKIRRMKAQLQTSKGKSKEQV